ncbi:MAG: sialidase [Gammaproteobacteria bacterium]|nr:sialidase [Gammaproteobacteria bacterium]MBV9621746.1 sialidase [Gammaproteobacteria bacterium]
MRPRVLLLALLLGAGARAEAPLPAEHARLAAQSLLIAIAAAGSRLVAVGDRGVIVLSDDGGAHWRQADAVPTQALLTGVCFFDARRGLAVGHDLVVLSTLDGGRSWRRTHYEPEAQHPLLDVWCGPDGRALAVGAYSTFLVSSDAGASWEARDFDALVRGAAAAGAPGGYHLNRIAGTVERLYIAGEAGHLYRSEDGGAHWRALPSPYAGSFFGVLPLADDAVLAFGLRGSLFRSGDGGASWERLDSGTPAMLDGGAALDAAHVALVGLSGVVLVSGDAGRHFRRLPQPDPGGLSAALPLGGAVVVVGESGAHRLALGGAP